MTKIRKALGLAALDNNLGLVLQLISTVVIARILTPTQLGIFAVAAVFASLASTFRDFGVAEYLIQEKELTDDTIRAALTVNIGISWLMALALFLGAPYAAAFYREPGVAQVMQLQAFNFLLIPFGAVTMAWFRREMNYKPIMLANVISNVLSFATSIMLALSGFGYMALAWASVVNVIATVSISLMLRPAGFPRWPGTRGIRRVLNFGTFASGVYIFGQLGKGAPEMVLGRVLDMASVGIFSRAGGLVEIFQRVVMRSAISVCLPYFAKGVREEGTPKRGLIQAMSYLTGVGWPFMACMGIGAFAAIRLMYGNQWMAAVALAQILCLVAAVELVYYPAKEAMLALGRAKESSVLQISMQLMRVVGLFAAIPWGLKGACYGLLIATVGGALHSHYYLHRLAGLTFGEVWRACLPSAWVALAAVAPMLIWAVLLPIDESNYLRFTLLAIPACTLCWLAGLRYSGHPMWSEVAGALTAIKGKLKRS